MKIGLDARWIFRELSGIGSYTRELIRQLARLAPAPDLVLYFHDKFSYAGDIVYGSVVLVIEAESEAELNWMYNALKEDGGVRYELQKTDWGALHAVVEDKHSVIWSLNYTLA